ncbi:MAG: prephenate dehydrogenase/arogenate dehydrogenase family protein [Dehalococcoidia bacterium]|nr:prephenate dehydrogenase/arogenate dehydrogenase family protein [Dehalococcoidia bacterium]
MRIAIIGLGLIGGSVGLALRRAEAGFEVVGSARRPEVASRALEIGAVDRTEGSLISAVKDAELVLIATPAMAMKEILAEIGGSLREGSIVTDTASTKAEVMDWAEMTLPPSVSFIGGHPLAGKETSGIEAADGDLFQGCTYCLIAGRGAAKEARDTVAGLVRQIGANPLFIDASEHDGLVAGISHLPLLISVALITATTKSPSWPEMARLAASGFRDLTRLASGDPRMSRDICLTNREPILHWIDDYIEEMRALRRLVSEGGVKGGAGESEKLEEAFMRAREEREGWLRI